MCLSSAKAPEQSGALLSTRRLTFKDASSHRPKAVEIALVSLPRCFSLDVSAPPKGRLSRRPSLGEVPGLWYMW